MATEQVGEWAAARALRGPLARVDGALSLVVLRGALQNMQPWVHDSTRGMVETGVFRLADLRRGRVPEIVRQFDDDWPGSTLELQVRMAQLADEWAKASPAERKVQLDELLEHVVDWLAAIEKDVS